MIDIILFWANLGLRSQPVKLDRATWLNYVRCHDDIGLGFDDADIIRAGYEPQPHRQFLVEYFTGVYPGSGAIQNSTQFKPLREDSL